MSILNTFCCLVKNEPNVVCLNQHQSFASWMCGSQNTILRLNTSATTEMQFSNCIVNKALTLETRLHPRIMNATLSGLEHCVHHRQVHSQGRFLRVTLARQRKPIAPATILTALIYVRAVEVYCTLSTAQNTDYFPAVNFIVFVMSSNSPLLKV